MGFNFGLEIVAVATSPRIVTEMEPQTSLTGKVISWNLGPLHLSAALPYIAKTMQKGAAVILLQEVLIRKGTTVKVRRELRQMFPKYERYIAEGQM